MLFFTIVSLFLLAVRQVLALTDAQVSACVNSVQLPEFQDEQTYDVNDQTSYSTLYTYDYSLCQGVPIISSSLFNEDSGASTTCTFSAFDSTQMFRSVCQITKGAMATYATNTGSYYDTILRVGKRPSILQKERSFQVIGSDSSTSTSNPPPTASGGMRKRTISVLAEDGTYLGSRSADEEDSAMCDKGYTACPVKDRKGFHNRCVNTSKNLFSCGGCPGTPGHQDCSDIDGVANVQCVSGQCQIKTCDRLHTLSLDGKTCIRKNSGYKRAYD